jgi:hypothetical protein
VQDTPHSLLLLLLLLLFSCHSAIWQPLCCQSAMERCVQDTLYVPLLLLLFSCHSTIWQPHRCQSATGRCVCRHVHTHSLHGTNSNMPS